MLTEDFKEMLDHMEASGTAFESSIEKPSLITLPAGPAYRYREPNIHHALIMKCARIRSLLRGATLLLQNGYVQEQAIICRAIEETNEDVVFLVYAIIEGDITDLHRRFLDAFWMEEIDDSGNMADSKQNRPMIPRKKIHSYIARIEGLDMNPHEGINTAQTIHKVFSGFVHGASPQIMDIYDGNSFRTAGVRDTQRWEEHVYDLWNFYYRSFLSHIMVAKAFGAEQIATNMMRLKEQFESKRAIVDRHIDGNP